MARWTWMACGIALLVAGLQGPAWADKVTLVNGDVLHGDVLETTDGSVRLRHAVLGEVELASIDVQWVTHEPSASPTRFVPVSASTPCAPCANAPASAETPCEKPALESAEKCKSPWDFAIGFGISNEAGNTEKFTFNTDIDTGYTWGLNEVRWRARAAYEEASGVQTENNLWSLLAYRRRITPRGRLFGIWLVQRDDFADIEYRNGWFVGYEHDFIRRERTTFSGAIGGGAVVEKRKGYPQLETAALFAQLDYHHEFQHGDTFDASLYVIPYLDKTELSPMRLELAYAHPLRKHLDLTAAFIAEYVPEPPDGIEPLDTKVVLGIRYRK